MLHCPHGYQPGLEVLVSEFVREGVRFVGVVGHDCSRVEDIIDEILVGDGTRKPCFVLTSSHPGETLAQAVEFARSLTDPYAGKVHVVEFKPNGDTASQETDR